jgi:hypothetical protein
MKATTAISLFVVFLLAQSSCADDAFLGTVGGNVFLSKSKNIQMVREDVRVEALRDSCLVHCRFEFFNEGKTQKCTVGFPDFVFSLGGVSEPLRGFQCQIEGRSVDVTRRQEAHVEGTDTIYANYWYAWEMTFASKEKVIVENDYVAFWGGSNSDTKDFAYVLGTGGSWRDPIGYGRIVIEHSEVASGNFVGDPWNDTLHITMSRFEDSTVFEFAEFRPEERAQVGFSLLSYWDDPARKFISYDEDHYFTTYLYGLDFFFDGRPRESNELREMISEIFARCGYVFRDSTMAAEFNGKSWYKPDSTFTLDKLNKYEHATVRFMQDRIRKPSR